MKSFRAITQKAVAKIFAKTPKPSSSGTVLRGIHLAQFSELFVVKANKLLPVKNSVNIP